MKFADCPLVDARVIERTPYADHRGTFSRIFCDRGFADNGVVDRFVQTNLSQNPKAGTLRGMHCQQEPHAEDKLVCCVHGAIWDVIVDLRRESPTYLKHFGIELAPDNLKMLLVPKGFAHGFLTLADDTVVIYQTSYPYTPAAEQGYRWDDLAFGIQWPITPILVSDKDRNWPLFSEAKSAA